MKKSKLLSLALTLALVFTTVFAGTESIFAASSQEMQAKSTDRINAVSLNSKDKADIWTVSYDQNSTTYIPVYIPKAGTFKIDLAGIDYQYGSQIKLKNGATAEAGAIGSYEYISSSSPEGVIFGEVSKGGTYYLEFSTTLPGTYKTAFSVSYAPAGGTLKSGTQFFGTSPNGKVSYYKITAPGTGYMKVTFPSTASTYSPSYSVKLMNSKKKSISGDYQSVYASKNYTTYFGVGKGTYYIAVKTSDPIYGIRTTYNKVTEKSGSTKSKAKSIYKKGTKKGIITASQSSTSGDWYKFKITKSQTVKFSISTLASSNGGLRVSFYKAGSSYAFGSQSFSSYTPSGTVQPYTYGYGKKLAPGTYYVKVQKYSGGNGYYKMKWL